MLKCFNVVLFVFFLPETPVNLSLTIDEKFDITLNDPNSTKYITYKTEIEKSVSMAVVLLFKESHNQDLYAVK